MTDLVLQSKPILERFSLAGRVALVTGGGQGIGRAFAHALGQAGAAVAVVDIVPAKAEEVAAELAGQGIDALAVQADVTRRDSLEAMLRAILKRWDRLTIAVNNAGVGGWEDAESVPEESWQRMMDINLKGVFLCAQVEAGEMLRAGYGKM